MQIALIGYGKMGKAIEEIALQRGHTIGLVVDMHNSIENNAVKLKNCDVAIEFSTPQSAVNNILNCINNGVPVVCGTTGWLKEKIAVEQYCIDKNGTFLYASNFSIGVNIFFELNKKLAALMARQSQYAISVEEIHHTAKKDAPSGTAISLAEQIIDNVPGKTKWLNESSTDPTVVPITSKRIDPAPGTHHVKYTSAIDDIEIIHTAHNRSGFALGAVLAAEFIYDKTGIFTMKDVLNIG
ncbi:MAG TPA: 4-hydroxy-tetrahydrodipicolinate reductase [Ferruginibacter sp.]|nr:4-hydroxy-tetrahydrodipicolinate reductase [Bacteroidota bacterium]MBS1926472.1 4-hydroxy-tetrahydrodipicolinate reductase [Bacteroidota bacterium]MCC6693924.1 4-hydroxy-tetrahydrodipicolinate reductase [Chitinophagaceae bacterium]HMT96575.1 4-hydroxy-tetrahydrodipicolinate reductase [Ferruginibacter sp.]HMU23418.1 4-hydroxy-tetrahydrodipicolinate reductase [Ferruginibacter sp.]